MKSKLFYFLIIGIFKFLPIPLLEANPENPTYYEKFQSENNPESLISLQSELDNLIPPEIKDDSFYRSIRKIAKTQNIKTIIEIGSSNGEGSTQAFVSGLLENPNKPLLFCMEISKVRFATLQNHYRHLPFVKCYYASSVPLEAFPKEDDIANFYNTVPSNLNNFTIDRIIGWLRQDIEYINTHNVPQNGIMLIKEEYNIDNFDVVLIDGSEFTGIAEFDLLYGAKFMLLDDIKTFKNYNNYQNLLADNNYELIEKNLKLRNGYAIFKLKNW